MNLPIHPMLRDIAAGLRSHPGRTLLSFLGIAVGAAALSILWNVTDALRIKASQMQSDFGVNIFSIIRPPDDSGERRPIRRAHLQLLAKNLPGAAVSGWQAYPLESDAGRNPYRLLVTDQHLPDVRPWKLTAGRFIDRTDIALRRHVAVLSKTLADRENIRPGDTFSIRLAPFAVVGIIDTGMTSLDTSDFNTALSAGERAAFIPWSLAPNWVTTYVPPEESLDALFVRASTPSAMPRELATARALFAQPDYLVPDAEWITPETVTRRIRQWQHLIEWSAGGIALL
ncbi:MAG: ABC transporter permease, partial [Kiritimatiellae bacterium]|nr:ABC transporter permease [Kiritimatiellia bacterium]